MGSYDPWSSENPILYFTWGNHKPSSTQPVFTMAYAKFDGTNWTVVNYLDDQLPNGGVSSHDGSLSDFVFNEYFTSGWGPFANKPGAQSKIPGVANERGQFFGPYANRLTIGYPLIGRGPLGLTSIETPVQNQLPDINTRTCLHMNPTMFTDASRRPSMAVYLFTNGPPPSRRSGCTLPDGRKIGPANYIYRYQGLHLGWQLDIDKVQSGCGQRCHEFNCQLAQ